MLLLLVVVVVAVVVVAFVVFGAGCHLGFMQLLELATRWRGGGGGADGRPPLREVERHIGVRLGMDVAIEWVQFGAGSVLSRAEGLLERESVSWWPRMGKDSGCES